MAQEPEPPQSYTMEQDDNTYYGLVNCSTNELCTFNGLPTIFLFDGTYNKGLDPEKIVGKKMDSFTMSDVYTIDGCFRLEEIECSEQYQVLNYTEYITHATFNVAAANKIETPIPSVFPYNKIPATELLPNDVDVKKAKKIMCEFATGMYQKMLEKTMGIKFCCPIDFNSSLVELKILKQELLPKLKIECRSC